MTSPVTNGTVFNEMIWDAVVAGGGMYVFANKYSVENAALLAWNTAMVGASQPLLSLSFDGIFKKRVNALSPILSTAFCYGTSLTLLPGAAILLKTDEARFNVLAAIYMLAITKGATRFALKTGIYPSLYSMAELSAQVVKLPFSAASSIFNSVIRSQKMQNAMTKISWLWTQSEPKQKEL